MTHWYSESLFFLIVATAFLSGCGNPNADIVKRLDEQQKQIDVLAARTDELHRRSQFDLKAIQGIQDVQTRQLGREMQDLQK